MTVAIMQPYFFPYLGYFQLIAGANTFIVYDDVSFIKQGWIARNRILVDGVPHTFSIPLKDASSFRLIKDTELHDRLYPIWRNKYLKTLTMAYQKAPYFEIVFNMVERVLFDEQKSIARLATQSLKAVCQYLSLQTRIVETSTHYQERTLTGQARVISICQQEKATRYLNVPGGVELYSPEEFNKNGIELSFVEYKLKPYPQYDYPFCSGLSIIDVMMFNSKDSCLAMLEKI